MEDPSTGADPERSVTAETCCHVVSPRRGSRPQATTSRVSGDEALPKSARSRVLVGELATTRPEPTGHDKDDWTERGEVPGAQMAQWKVPQ